MKSVIVVLICVFVNSVICLAQTWLSPQHITYNKHTEKIYVSLSTAGRIAVLDSRSEALVKQIDMPDNPGGLVTSPDGISIYVTSPIQHRVYRLTTSDGKIRNSVRVGHTPSDVALSADGGRLWVINRFSNDLSVIELQTFVEICRIPVKREPFAIAVSPDDDFVAVANFLPTGSMLQNQVAAEVTIVDAMKLNVIKHIQLPTGSSALYDLCFSPDGRFLYITHILARFQLPTLQLDRGWVNTNALSVIDARELEWVNTVLLDDVDRGAANPAGMAVSKNGKSLYIALSGIHELCVLDLDKLHQKLFIEDGSAEERMDAGTNGRAVVDLSLTVDMKQRLPLHGKGPRHMIVVDEKIYIANYFSSSLDVFDSDKSHTPRFLSLGNEPEMNDERLGNLLFHDASLCFQNWQSCASCHPGEARVDGFNWDLLNDGIGNPKNTKTLLLSHQTPPAMSTGIRPDAETAVRAGLRHIQFVERPEEDARKIDTYLKGLKPVPSPFLDNIGLGKAARRGEKIFKSSACGDCHNGANYTDGQQYNVGTGSERHKETRFDTPTLIEVWRTAPYLYDGRAATLEQVFTDFNKEDRHGKTSKLSDREFSDLIEFIKSL